MCSVAAALENSRGVEFRYHSKEQLKKSNAAAVWTINFFMRPILLSPLLLPSHCHAAIAPHKYMGSHLMAENALTPLPLSEINRWNRSLRTHRREKEKSETRTAHLAPSLMLNRNTASWRRL